MCREEARGAYLRKNSFFWLYVNFAVEKSPQVRYNERAPEKRLATTGRGFLREQLKRLNRGEGTQDESGHGLGLRIVRDVARAHGGRVRFDNLPEGGGRCVIDGLHPTRRAGRKISS